MNKINSDKSYTWKNWIIKKLLSNDSTKEDILNFIANEESENELKDINDNNKDDDLSFLKKNSLAIKTVNDSKNNNSKSEVELKKRTVKTAPVYILKK